MRRSRYVPLAVAVVTAFLPACDRSPAAAPDYVPVHMPRLVSACVVAPATTLAGTVGSAGGSFSVAGVSVQIPAGALATDTRFDITVPSSPFAEVEIRANGQDHFRFLSPVVVAISYDDCTGATGTLSAWHIDPETKLLLENMGGVDDRQKRRIVFSTMHLSGYAIAN